MWAKSHYVLDSNTVAIVTTHAYIYSGSMAGRVLVKPHCEQTHTHPICLPFLRYHNHITDTTFSQTMERSLKIV